jgi:two-component system, cell cycle sensor histidine kinase and response regulator CckA
MELMEIYHQAMATWTLLRTKFADGLEAVLHLLERRRSREGELEYTTREGQCITVESRIGLVREAEHASGLAVNRDITARKRAEKKIQEQVSLLELAHDAIFVRSLDEKIQYWNKGAEQLYGWTAEEAIDGDFGKMAYNDRTPFEVAKKLLLEEENWSGEVRKLTKARREVVVASRWTLVRDGQGNPSSILVIDTDITEKKQLEAQFLRTQRLELIGTLAGGIAHDFNNILQVIITNLDLAASAPAFDERLPKYLEGASQGANRAANLARRLLTFSKGGAPIKQPLEVAEILTHAVLLALSGSKLKPRFAFQRDLYPVIGDPVQLTQVIENVVINACEATPQRGRLLVRAENVDERIPASSGLPAGRYVRIEIEDRGTGIPESIRHRISEAFFTTKPGGSGLGLATVNSIMQQHGGSITIESRVGRGTTVSLMLPAAAHRPEPPVASLPSPVVKTTGRILLIDDEEMILSVVGSMLNTLGYECAVAKDGVEGCNEYVRAKADGNPFAAVLLDGTIPNGLAGEEALKLLLEADPNARVILCSGYADSDLFKKAEQLGFRAVLAKPFSMSEFVSVLNKVLS